MLDCEHKCTQVVLHPQQDGRRQRLPAGTRAGSLRPSPACENAERPT
jgi:hypothetical protein